jgi:hypothetical protein
VVPIVNAAVASAAVVRGTLRPVAVTILAFRRPLRAKLTFDELYMVKRGEPRFASNLPEKSALQITPGDTQNNSTGCASPRDLDPTVIEAMQVFY